ncbi:MAG: sterol desaturase family protein [Burkholderiaceae bacterium]|nr:sterol desaturase family protein [Burkholderiaceae bacterium]
MLDPIIYAVPVFLAMMAAEYAVERRRGEPVYRAADTISSLSLGILSQLVAAFSKLAALGIYTLVWQHAAIWPLPADSAWVWVGALLAYDFCYYWLHRMGHEVNILWAAHVVHHSSEEYNLSTALRQTATGHLFGWLFYLPLALAGVPPLVFVVVGLIDLLYQFWVHTRQVGKLGWFDRVFCSPSNHRVHHGQNDWCLDRNYGGILILWDRLFGTFTEERDGEAIVYGIRGQLGSFDPLRANLHVYADLWRDIRLTRRGSDKLRVLFAHPGWRPADAAAAAPKPAWDLSRFERYAPPLPAAWGLHALLQLAVLIAFSLHFLAVVPSLGLGAGLAYAGLIGAQLVALSRLTEWRPAALRIEAARWAAGVLAVALSPLHGWPWLVLALASGSSAVWAVWALRAMQRGAALPVRRSAPPAA